MSNYEGINPLSTINSIPQSVKLLPNTNLQSLIDDPHLISSFIRQTQEFLDYINQLLIKIDDDSSKLLKIQTLIDQYQTITTQVTQQLTNLQYIYHQYNNLQTIQYQLLLNFNQNYLLNKFEKNVSQLNQECLQKIKSDDPDLKFIQEFRQSRKNYHLQREKLNRWKEERVSGFV
jgi:uncharacterized membrane protein YgaE (UPF0421/DUF939 family)